MSSSPNAKIPSVSSFAFTTSLRVGGADGGRRLRATGGVVLAMSRSPSGGVVDQEPQPEGAGPLDVHVPDPDESRKAAAQYGHECFGERLTRERADELAIVASHLDADPGLDRTSSATAVVGIRLLLQLLGEGLCIDDLRQALEALIAEVVVNGHD